MITVMTIGYIILLFTVVTFSFYAILEFASIWEDGETRSKEAEGWKEETSLEGAQKQERWRYEDGR